MMRRRAAQSRLVAGTALLLLIGSCAAVPKSVPPPLRQPIPVTIPPPPALPPASAWDTLPIIEGGWTYDPAARAASFANERGEKLVSLYCMAAPRAVRLTVWRDGARQIDVLTSAGANRVEHDFVGAMLPVNDITLDRIAFSRGRFALRGNIIQVLPVQSEIGRVIEDCRGAG